MDATYRWIEPCKAGMMDQRAAGNEWREDIWSKLQQYESSLKLQEKGSDEGVTRFSKIEMMFEIFTL